MRAWLRLARWFRCEHIAGHAARDSLNMGRCPIPKNLLCFRYRIVTNETVTGYLTCFT